MRDQVGISKDTEYGRKEIVRAGSEEGKKIAVEQLTIKNPLRALKNDAFVWVDPGIPPENAEIEE